MRRRGLFRGLVGLGATAAVAAVPGVAVAKVEAPTVITTPLFRGDFPELPKVRSLTVVLTVDAKPLKSKIAARPEDEFDRGLAITKDMTDSTGLQVNSFRWVNNDLIASTDKGMLVWRDDTWHHERYLAQGAKEALGLV